MKRRLIMLVSGLALSCSLLATDLEREIRVERAANSIVAATSLVVGFWGLTQKSAYGYITGSLFVLKALGHWAETIR